MKGNKRCREIVFDPEEREKYLRGFSERKKQRRAFGLAMQKVKDRKAKLEDRREQKKEELQRVEEAECQKRRLLEESLGRAAEVDKNESEVIPCVQSKRAMYKDDKSQQQWGGRVIVTTTVAPLSDGSDDEEESARKKQSIDSQQQYAGNVAKYMNQLKGAMPKKKATQGNRTTKGNHGAANMKGIGGASNLKLAKKALSKVQGKTSVVESGKKKRRRR